LTKAAHILRKACALMHKICAAVNAQRGYLMRASLPMSAIPLTIFFSLLLAGLFVVLFAREQKQRRFASAERDSLLPLADELPVTPIATPKAHDADDHDHDHAHDHDHHHHAGSSCGCRDGSRPPCVGCLRKLAPAPAPASPFSRT
jgi:hypothetical protein